MRSTTDRSIERYVSGRMSPAEQREFARQAESDPGVRRLLKAEETIERAVTADRAALPIAAAEPGARLLEKLAASHPAESPSGISLPSGAGAAGGSLAKIIGSVVATLAVITAVLVVTPFNPFENTSHETTLPAGSTFTAPAGQGKTSSVTPANASAPASQHTTVSPEEESIPAVVRNATPEAERSDALKRDNIPAATIPEGTSAQAPVRVDAPAADHRPSTMTPVEFQDDTLRLRFDVKEQR